MRNHIDPFAVLVFLVLGLVGGLFVKLGSNRLTPEQVRELTDRGADLGATLAMFGLFAAGYLASRFPVPSVIAAVGLTAISLYRISYRLQQYWAGPGRLPLIAGTTLLALGAFLFVAVTAWRATF